jgi:hypothetical protein
LGFLQTAELKGAVPNILGAHPGLTKSGPTKFVQIVLATEDTEITKSRVYRPLCDLCVLCG